VNFLVLVACLAMMMAMPKGRVSPFFILAAVQLKKDH